MTDLLLSAKDQLYREIVRRGTMKTSEVIKWGTENYSNRAERNMRQLAKEGLVVRLSDTDKIMAFGNIKEDVWRDIGGMI